MILAKARRPAEGTTNPFRLPRGEKLRREVVAVFREQRTAIIRWIRTGEKDAPGLLDPGHRLRPWDRTGAAAAGLPRILALAGRKDQQPPVPLHWPDWDDFGLGALKMSERMTPILALTWEAAADAFAPRVGLDPNSWSVVNPYTEQMIEEAALAFCQSTNDTTSQQLDAALADLRDQLNRGIVQHGEALDLIAKRVGAIFDGAETWRARRIAFTETSRAVHAAQEQAAIHSGVVTGWKWLLSSDACPTCVAIAARCPAVRLGRPFAVIGDDPHYASIKFPPAHPHCACSLVEVLDTDPQPAWGDTLHDPDPATDAETERVGADVRARDEAILKPPKRPATATRPKPLPPKKPPEPGWRPGDGPIDPDRPIGERIAAAKHLEERRKAIAGLPGVDQEKIRALESERNSLNREITAFLKGGGSQMDPKVLAMLKEFDRRNIAILKQIEAVREENRLATRKAVNDALNLGRDDRARWNHVDGDGFEGKAKNVATRKGVLDWLEAKVSRGRQGDVAMVRWHTKPNVRAYAHDYDRLIMVKANESPETMAHEMGHHVEYRLPGVKRAAQDFLSHRVGDQPIRKFNDVIPGATYRADEMGRDDDFAKAFGKDSAWYVGKHYAHGSTEIVSMGVEKLYNDPAGFAKNDPEYFKFIAGILDGSLRTP